MMQQGNVTPKPLVSLARNLWASLNMLLFRRSAMRWLVTDFTSFIILLILSLTTSFLFDFLAVGWPGELSLVGLAVYLLPPFFLLVFGQLLAVRHGLWRLGLAPVILWLASDVLLGIAQCGLQYATSQGQLRPEVVSAIPGIYAVLYIWPVLAIVLVLTRTLLWPIWERIIALAILLTVFTAWSLTLSNERIWFVSSETLAAEQTSRLLDEDVFHAQGALLPKALDALQAERPGQTDWYFLGIAGAAYQDVFYSEAESVRALFDNRFATEGRSLVLVNNDETALHEPIATRSNITQALKGIAEKMDKENDVLFLFISSHGTEDHQIELNYWPLKLEFISPEWLRKALDQSGIRRRVIVLSACYSGGFIPALQSPDTLVITAADSKSASFGCLDDAEFTYFGRAFFDEALRREYSLQAAFDRARVQIGQRERRGNYEHSNPQWWEGHQMKEDLPLLQNALFPPQPMRLPEAAHPYP